MNSPAGLSEGCLDALQRLKETRETNTVILRGTPGGLVAEVEGNLTHEELLQALPVDEPRLVVHELSFASPEGMRRNERVLILWVPSAASEQDEAAYTPGYTSLAEFLADVHVHLTARRTDQLAYQRLVALAG